MFVVLIIFKIKYLSVKKINVFTNNKKESITTRIIEKTYIFKINLLLLTKLIIFLNFNELDNYILYIKWKECIGG